MVPSDIDQIHADLASPRHLEQHKATKAPEDLPGLGRWYCVECAKWFETEGSLVGHKKGKPHKRRLKQLAVPPYTQREAEAAAGLAPPDNVGYERRAAAEGRDLEGERVERTINQEVEMASS